MSSVVLAQQISTDKEYISFGEELAVHLTIPKSMKEDILEVRWDSLIRSQCPFPGDSIYYDIDIEWVSAGNFQGDDQFWDQQEIIWNTSQESENELINTFVIKIWEFFDCPLQGVELLMKDSSIIATNVLPPLSLQNPLESALNPLTLGTPIREIIDSTKLQMEESFSIIRGKLSWKDFVIKYIWIFIILLLFLLAIIYFNLFYKPKSKNIEVETPVPSIAAHELALQQLYSLKEGEKWKIEGEKYFVSTLTAIIRKYIDGNFQVPALEMTSMEIKEKLKPMIGSEYYTKLSNTLDVSDLVKFAKAKGNETIYNEFVEDAIDFVHQTKKI